MLFVNFSKKSSIWIVIWQKRQYYNPNYIKIQVAICEKSVFPNLAFCGIMVIITKIVSLCSFFNQNEFIEGAVSYKEKGNYMKDLYRDYRRKYLIYILYVLVIVTIAQLFFVEPLKAGSYLTNATAKKYLMKNILLPAGINAVLYLATFILLRNAKIKPKNKNYILLTHAATVAMVFAVSKITFMAALAFLIFPVFMATIFGEKSYLNYSLLLSILSLLIVPMVAPFFSLVKLENQLFSYVIVLIILFVMWIMATLLNDFSRSRLSRIEESELHKEDLEGQLLRDAMTGLYNHTAFYAFLEKFTVKNTSEEKIALAVLDIDNFKKVNDTYGHGKGDEVIVFLAKVLQERCGEEHYVCRYGGEEFAVIFRGIGRKEALKEMEWILEKFRKHRFEWTTEPITFSCGISEYASGLMTDKELFSITDKILYRAKENGKNRCLL